MDDADPHAQRARQLNGTIHRVLGRPYRVAWEKLDAESMREVERMIRDMNSELQRARHSMWGP